MNERIQELAELAGFRLIRENCYDVVSAASVQEFAKLIALECARLAMTQHHSTNPDDYDDMEPYEQGCDDTASNISGLINRVFEVE